MPATSAIARFGADRLPPERWDELADWVRTLGVDPAQVRTCGAVIHAHDTYQLHLSRFVTDEQGRRVVDYALNDTVSEPLVIDLGTERCWPDWLGMPDVVFPGRLEAGLPSPVLQRQALAIGDGL